MVQWLSRLQNKTEARSYFFFLSLPAVFLKTIRLLAKHKPTKGNIFPCKQPKRQPNVMILYKGKIGKNLQTPDLGLHEHNRQKERVNQWNTEVNRVRQSHLNKVGLKCAVTRRILKQALNIFTLSLAPWMDGRTRMYTWKAHGKHWGEEQST